MAALVADVPTRVRKRADRLLADCPWTREDTTFTFENATVTVAADPVTDAAQLTCTCLIAPRCAHLAAIALSLPTTDAPLATPPAPDTPPPEEAPPTEEPPPETTLSDDQRQVVATTHSDLVAGMPHGWAHPSVTLRGRLLADLHLLRSAGLVTAERELTALINAQTASHRARSLAGLLLTLHRLDRGDLDAIGTARQHYAPVSGLSLTPLFAEPVHTDSGYAGATVTFVGRGQTWELARIRPATSGAAEYTGSADWGGTSTSVRDWSRHRAVVAEGTATASGRLGSGRRVRVALGAAAALWEDLPSGFRCVDGEITDGDRHGLEVAGQRFVLTEAAIRLDAGRGLELFAHSGAHVRVLIRDGRLLGLRPLDATIVLPDELHGVWWPGLDPVERSWVGAVTDITDTVVDPGAWPTTPASVRSVIDRWVIRVADAGSAALIASVMEADARWLRAAGAPFAADLLTRLAAAPQQGHRAFDGTWVPDAEALTRAWLALATY